MNNNVKGAIGSLLLHSATYVGIASLLDKIDSDTSQFWIILGALVAIRTFFLILEMLVAWSAWRLWGKAMAVDMFLSTFRENNFPPRYYPSQPAAYYLADIESDETLSQKQRTNAIVLQAFITMISNQGILPALRIGAAATEALNKFAPQNASSVTVSILQK